MTKPWEENWEADVHGNACECPSMVRRTDAAPLVEGDDELFFANDGGRANSIGRRLKLAAAAPDMARLLLRFEWVPDSDFGPSCPECRAERSNSWRKPGDGHQDDCEWVAAMQKAGVVE